MRGTPPGPTRAWRRASAVLMPVARLSAFLRTAPWHDTRWTTVMGTRRPAIARSLAVVAGTAWRQRGPDIGGAPGVTRGRVITYACHCRSKVRRKHAGHTVHPLLGVVIFRMCTAVIDTDGDGRVPGKPSGRDRSRGPVVVRLGNPDHVLPAQQFNRLVFPAVNPSGPPPGGLFSWPAARSCRQPVTGRGLKRSGPPTASTMPNAAAFAARAPLAAARGGLGIEDDRAATTSGTPTQPCAVCGRSRYAPTGRCTPPAPPPSAAPPRTGAATRH